MTIDEDCLQPDDMPTLIINGEKVDYADACVIRHALIQLAAALVDDPGHTLGPIGKAYQERADRLSRLFHV